MEIKPQRIQRRRVKGFKLESPNGLPNVYVGRPSRWGNPYKIQSDIIMGDARHRRTVLSSNIYCEVCSGDVDIHTRSVELYEQWIHGYNPYYLVSPSFTIEDIKKELKGKNLVCFCSLNEKCHADFLLKIANEE